jgi:spore protease
MPDAVILVDALASRKIERVGTTIQLADTGIAPGSGVGNKRMELNSASLGRPVVAIGVPTVVDAATMANDVINQVIDGLTKTAPKDSGFYSMLKNMGEDDRYKMIWDSMEPWARNMIVTPREVDEIIDNMSKTIANSINMALHKSISIEQLDRFLN